MFSLKKTWKLPFTTWRNANRFSQLISHAWLCSAHGSWKASLVSSFHGPERLFVCLPSIPAERTFLLLLPWNSSRFQGLWLPLVSLGHIILLPWLWPVLPSGAHLHTSSHSPNLVHSYPENGRSFSRQNLFPVYQTIQCHNIEDHNMSYHHCEWYISLSEQRTNPPRCFITWNSKNIYCHLFRVCGLLDPEDGGSMLLWYLGNVATRLWSSITAMWILHILWIKKIFLCIHIQIVIWYFLNIKHLIQSEKSRGYFFLNGSRTLISSQWNTCERPLFPVYYLNYTIHLHSIKHFSNSFITYWWNFMSFLLPNFCIRYKYQITKTSLQNIC